MVVGFLVALAGLLAVAAPLLAGLSIAIAVGFLLVVSGVSRLFFAFRMGSFGHGLVVFLIGLVSIAAGAYMVSQPGAALATLTLFLAVYLAVDGVGHILWAFRIRPIRGWGWTLASGIAGLVLGVMIWRQFPLSGVWAIGTLVGIQMLFGGLSITSLCGAVRKEAAPA